MIDQGTIDKIFDAAQIVDVVSDFVSLKRRGANYIGLCPFHNERTPSFSVSPAKNICKCFSCGKGGNPIHFIMELEQISFIDAVKYLAKKYGIVIEERELTDEEKRSQSEREAMLVINKFASEQFQKNLFETSEGENVALAYFHERGFRNDIIRKFQLGYSLEERDHFSQTAIRHGYNRAYLLKTGLSLEGQNGELLDRFRGRVMFPIHSVAGKELGFGGRILKKNDKLAKYQNSPASVIYDKSHELYGLFFAKQSIVKHDRCFLVEGYTDVLAMHQAGIENVVSSSGTALTEGQIQKILKFTSNITVIYDGDAAGKGAALKGIDKILKEGMNVKLVMLPTGEDPDSFSRKQNASQFIEYISQHETDFIRYKISSLIEESGDDPIKRAALIVDIVRTIAIIPEQIKRSVYIREASRLMEISEELLIGEVNKAGVQLSNLSNLPTPITERKGETEPIPAPEPAKPVAGSIFDRFEQAIIRYIVRYGDQTCYTHTDQETGVEYTYSTIEYLLLDLEADHIEFHHPLYAKILAEAKRAWQRGELNNSERYFLRHPDMEISRLAAVLVTDPYTLSKIHTKFATVEEEKDKLDQLIPRVVNELKDAMMQQKLKEINEKIRAATLEQDADLVVQLMGDMKAINDVRSQLAKALGERIVTRY